MTETIAMLERLAEKLGATGETLFRYLVERQLVLGFIYTIGGLLSAIAGIYIIHYIFLRWKNIINTEWIAPIIFGILIAIVAIIIGATCFFEGITYVVAPEGATIIKILELTK